MRICSGAGCLRAVPDDVKFCDECRPPAKPDDGIASHTYTDRERYGFLYKTKRWETVRALVIRSQPMCAECRRRLSQIVDHIVPAGVAIVQAQDSGLYLDKYAGFYFRHNLQGLCRVCHYAKTLKDKTHTGAWPSVVRSAERRPPVCF